MKSKRQETVELEAELLRLNALVRQRRAQLERLEDCPNKDCECRRVWHEVMDGNLADQVGKIRKKVASKKKAPGSARAKARQQA